MTNEPNALEAAERNARDAILQRPDVSRETFEELATFRALLLKWTRKINLISRADEQAVWNRHILDSLSIADLLPADGLWTDMGSGGGFPAIPLAILAKGTGRAVSFRLIESDRRKCAFLVEASARLGLSIKVERQRIEDTRPEGEKIVSARALAPVAKLLDLLESYQAEQIPLALMKGEGLHQELTEASRHWHMRYQTRRATTTSRGYICLMQRYRHVAATRPGEP